MSIFSKFDLFNLILTTCLFIACLVFTANIFHLRQKQDLKEKAASSNIVEARP